MLPPIFVRLASRPSHTTAYPERGSRQCEWEDDGSRPTALRVVPKEAQGFIIQSIYDHARHYRGEFYLFRCYIVNAFAEAYVGLGDRVQRMEYMQDRRVNCPTR